MRTFSEPTRASLRRTLVSAACVLLVAGAPGCPGEPEGPPPEATARNHFLLGQQWVASGNLPKAQAEFETATRLDPGHASYHHALGEVLLARREPLMAEASFRKALTLKDDWSVSWLGLGRALAAQGRGDAALKAFRSALERRADDPEALRLVSEALTDAGDVEGAAQALQQSYDLRRQALVAALEKAGLSPAAVSCQDLPPPGARTDPAEASRSALCALRDNAVTSAVDLGDFLGERERWTAAADAYRAAAAARPADPELLHLLGGARVRAGDLAGALEAYAVAAEHEEQAWRTVRAALEPAEKRLQAAGGPDARTRLTPNTREWDAWREAQLDYNAAARDEEGAAVAASLSWQLIGGLQQALGRPEAALEALHKALEIRPQSASAWEAIGRVHLAAGETEEARAAALEALPRCAEDADDDQVLIGVADLLHQVGEHERAAAVFRMLAQEPGADPSLWWQAARASQAQGDAAWTRAACERLGAAAAKKPEALAEASAWCRAHAPDAE